MRNGTTTFAIAQAQFAAFGAKILASVCVRCASLLGNKPNRLEKRLSYLALGRHDSHRSRRISERRSSGWRRSCEWLASMCCPARMCPACSVVRLHPVVGS